MMLVVAILSCGKEARLCVIGGTISCRFESLDFGGTREVEAGERQHDVAVLVALESEWVSVLDDGLHDVAIDASIFNLTKKIFELRSRNGRPRYDNSICHVNSLCCLNLALLSPQQEIS